MPQQLTGYPAPQAPRKMARPKRLDIFLHMIKTSRLLGALGKDGRISIARKVFFFGAILALLLILLFPDALDEAFLSLVMPIVGTVLGVPLDAGFDWIAFALAVVSLLRIFPAPIVSEHYERVFRKARA